MRHFFPLDKLLWCLAGMILLLAACVPALGEDGPALRPARLKVGFIESTFLGINHRDAEAAFKTFARTIGRTEGYDVEVEVVLFKSARELDALQAEERPELIILETWNYLDLKNPGWLKPVCVTADREQVAKRFLLLTGNPDLNSLADLRGKSLNLFMIANAELGHHWLQALLRERKLGTVADFFGRVELHTEPMRAILPVFFQSRDAVVIDSAKLELMAELNPQLNRLKVINSSQPLVNGVLCVKRSGWSSAVFQDAMLKVLPDLHRSPAGQQILHLFRLNRLVPFEDHFLDEVRKLRHRTVSRQNSPGKAFPGGNI
ncbi:MAG: PhnD/SsuA/transferrin family substrate-binding protein [Syntrophotaleaceae bacterium]